MKIYLKTNEENIKVFFDTQVDPLFLPHHKIIIILWNQVNKKILIINQETDLQDFILKLPEYQNKFIYHFYLCYNFLGNINWLEQLAQIWNSSMIHFSSLHTLWYCVKIKNKIWDDNIVSNNLDNFVIDINTEYDCEEDILQNLQDEIATINLEIINLEDTMKNSEIQEIILLKNNLRKQYLQYQAIMENKIEMIQKLNSKLEEYQKNITHFNPKNHQQSIQHKNIIGSKKVLEEINFTIQNSKQQKNKKQAELNLLNVQLEDTQNKLNHLHLNLENNKSIQTQVYKIEDPEIQVMNPQVLNATLNSKIGVFLHLYDFNMFPEFCEYLSKLTELNLNFDLYINLAIDPETNKSQVPEILDKIQKSNITLNIFITYSDNKGLDIGGFIKSYLKMLENGKKYDSIIKLHSKTNPNWRFIMLYSLLGNQDIIQHNLNLLKKEDVGMIGYEIKELDYRTNKIVKYYLLEYRKKLNIPEYEGFFVPGTIFWIKSCILEKYFTLSFLQKTYQEFKPYYCGSNKVKSEGKPHAFERFFGLLVHNAGLLTVKYDYMAD